MIQMRALIMAAFIVLAMVGIADAEDCGCGGSWDSPSDDWDDGGSGSFDDDSGDDSSSGDSGNSGDGGNSGDSGNSGDGGNSGDSGNSGDGSSSWSDGSGDGRESDTGNSGSSTDSGSSSVSSGGTAEDSILWRIKGDDLFTKGQYNESLAAYENALSYDPYSFKAWKGKGTVLLTLNRTDDAGNAFKKALKLDPSDASTYALFGDAHFTAGEYADAAEQYLKALAMNPNLSGVTEKLSAAYAAEQSGLPPGAGTSGNVPDTTLPTQIQTTAMVYDNATVTAEATSTVLPLATKAGISGGFTGTLALVLSLLLVGLRRK